MYFQFFLFSVQGVATQNHSTFGDGWSGNDVNRLEVYHYEGNQVSENVWGRTILGKQKWAFLFIPVHQFRSNQKMYVFKVLTVFLHEISSVRQPHF